MNLKALSCYWVTVYVSDDFILIMVNNMQSILFFLNDTIDRQYDRISSLPSKGKNKKVV